MKTAFFDVDTQLDFVYPAGALYTPGAESIVKPVRDLTRFAMGNKIQIVSTTDFHSEDDPEFKEWRSHCVAHTAGQQKLEGSVTRDSLVLPSIPGALDQVQSRIAAAPQVIVQKQKIDCFTNPNLKPLLKSMGAERFVVYGLLTEFCVQCALFGLLDLGFQVEVVTDAIKSFASSRGEGILEQFRTRGGRFTSLREVAG